MRLCINLWTHLISTLCKHVSFLLVFLTSHPGTLSSRVLVVLNEPSQAEVGDLAHQIVTNEDVSCTQVTVDVVHPLDVRHSSCNLHARRDKEILVSIVNGYTFLSSVCVCVCLHLRSHVYQLRQLQALPLSIFQEVQQTS